MRKTGIEGIVRWIGIAVVIVVVLVVIAAFAVPRFVNVNQYHDRIQAELQGELKDKGLLPVKAAQFPQAVALHGDARARDGNLRLDVDQVDRHPGGGQADGGRGAGQAGPEAAAPAGTGARCCPTARPSGRWGIAVGYSCCFASVGTGICLRGS